jgi:hypothetical protein
VAQLLVVADNGQTFVPLWSDDEEGQWNGACAGDGCSWRPEGRRYSLDDVVNETSIHLDQRH